MFEIEVTDEFIAWWESLTDDQRDALRPRIDLLAERGPALRRPTVGEIVGSKNDPQMKELRVGSLRVLFIFDPEQTGILLLGGDKAIAGWKAWYRKAIETADDLYDTYLAEIAEEKKARGE